MYKVSEHKQQGPDYEGSLAMVISGNAPKLSTDAEKWKFAFDLVAYVHHKQGTGHKGPLASLVRY